MCYVFPVSWMTSHCSTMFYSVAVVVTNFLTPLLRGISCLVSWTTSGAKTGRLLGEGMPGRSMR